MITWKDLSDDFEELEYLVWDSRSKLNHFSGKLKKNTNNIHTGSYKNVSDFTQFLINKYKKINDEITNGKQILKSGKISEMAVYNLIQKKGSLFDQIRVCQNIFPSVITSLDWQSPSFLNSVISQAGLQTGKIQGTINDYKRDTHLDEECFEKAYLKEYVVCRWKIFLRAFLTGSGMSAFTAIFNYLLAENKLSGKVIIGKNVYFQYKQILEKTLGKNIVKGDESDLNQLILLIKKYKPDAVFLDSLTNAKNIIIPELNGLIEFLRNGVNKETYLVIDNTGASVFFQPFKNISPLRSKLRIICFESLNKYYQFGMDRVTAGIIIAMGKDIGKISEYRKHTGTNIPDTSVYALPTPNRKLLLKKLDRHKRNAVFLASQLESFIKQNGNCPVAKIIYPGFGSYFNLDFEKNWNNTRHLKNFLKTVVMTAKKRKVNIIAGTTFGIPVTRVYLTSLWTKYGEPFIRIAVGTETFKEIAGLREVFQESFKQLARNSM